MEDKFTVEEKRRYLMKKHIKNHFFEYFLDVIGTVIITIILLTICKAETYFIGVLISFVYSLTRVLYRIYCYKKEYIDIEFK